MMEYSLLMSFVKSTMSNNTLFESKLSEIQIDSSNNPDSNEDIEQMSIKIASDDMGKLVDTHQVHHYYHCADTLLTMSFYDFCQCIKKKFNIPC